MSAEQQHEWSEWSSAEKEQKTVDYIQSLGIRPVLNAKGKACLHIPDDGGPKEHEIRGERIWAFVHEAYKSVTSQEDSLKEAEVKRVQAKLIDAAHGEGEPATDQGSDQLARKPVVEAVVLFMHGSPRWEGRTRDLLQEFHKPAIREKVSGRLPAFTAQLTNELKVNRQELRLLGLLVEHRHTDKGSRTTITRLSHADPDAAEGVSPESSVAPSDGTHKPANSIPKPDDADAPIRREVRRLNLTGGN